MDFLSSDVADVRVVHVVRLIAFFTTIDKFTRLPIIDLFWLPDNELVFAYLEHTCHHE